ncbi:hypothetical protein [Nocardia sp. CA-120079]|uniref:hypothetical protein n=1 Tax=Nocardia sp. CA-120079 TaxID=3239974 RepID=UPI003D9615AC
MSGGETIRDQPKGPAAPAACPWCADPNADEHSDALCIDHQAEFEGLSVNQLIDRDRIQYEEANGI